MISIKPITSKDQWEEYVLSRPEANFLQSWNWGQFHLSLNKKVDYLGLFDSDKLQGVCLCVLESAKRGRYITIAGGPLIDWRNATHLNSLIAHLQFQAKAHGALFIRLRPQILDTHQNRELLTQSGFTLSPMHLTADLTIELDLTKSPDELLQSMRKSTRYEINKAQKLDIQVTTSVDPKDINTFYKHQLNLARKHNFVPFSYPFLFNQFSSFALDNQVALFHASHNHQLLASAFIIFYGQEAVYHYGISTPQNQKLPGSHAALWSAILAAKKRGLSRFNLWGVAPDNSPDHRFHGVTIFKTGFGGQQVAYLPAHDLPVSKLYSLTNLFEKFRAKSRHLR